MSTDETLIIGLFLLTNIMLVSIPVLGESNDQASSIPPGMIVKKLDNYLVIDEHALLEDNLVNATPLAPGKGDGYSFNGTGYSDGWIEITSPGSYYLTHDLHTRTSDYAIRVATDTPINFSSEIPETPADYDPSYINDIQEPGGTPSSVPPVPAQNVTLNGNGYNLIYEGSDKANSTGIDIIQYADGTTLSHFGDENSRGIAGFGTAIQSDGNATLVSTSRITDGGDGINLSGSYSLAVANEIKSLEGTAINSSGVYSLMVANAIDDTGRGIITTGDGLDITSNTITGSKEEGVTVSGTFELVSGNLLLDVGSGITADGNMIDISNNAISKSDSDGITVTAENITVSENTVSNCEYGINSSGNQTNIALNLVKNSKVGIRSTDEVKNIDLNTLARNDVGLEVHDLDQVGINNYFIGNRKANILVINNSDDSLLSPSADPATGTVPESEMQERGPIVISPLTKLILSQVEFNEGGTNTTGNVIITLTDMGSKLLPIGTKIILTPANALAQKAGTISGILEGKQLALTLPVSVPTELGSYEYIFNPQSVSTISNDNEYSPVGPPVTFYLIVGEDGSVSTTR